MCSSDLEADPELQAYAMQVGQSVFGDNCATCHGAGGAGGKGYPNLRDDVWLWGGSLDAIQHDLIIAVVLVGAVMLLFLHQWRNTAIVLLSIPTVLVSTFLFMYALGFTLNIMTLMALALMIGILVDDSIVVLENIHRHLELGEGAREAAYRGRAEIGMAAIADRKSTRLNSSHT